MYITFHDILMYILCFVGFFTSFIFLLTIMSPKKKKYPLDPNFRPKISIIIPMWNEGTENGKRLRKTLDSVLSSHYPKNKIEIIIVNDGSTDNSLEIVKPYKKFGIKIISYKKSHGKTYAINQGMKIATGELVAGFDADSYMMPDVLEKLVPCFKDKNVMAAIPSIKISKPTSFIQQVQFQEFLSAVFIRHVQSELGSIPLAPGAFTLVRNSFVKKHGALRTDTMVEDLELSLRIQSEGYLIENVVNANVYTSGVKTLKAFANQRLRWFVGFIIQMKRYKHLIHPRYGNLGVFILPISIVYIILTIFVFCYAIIMFIINSVKWVNAINLVGFRFKNLFDFKFDLYYLTIDNTTILPLFLFIILLLFMFYIKRISEEKEGILKPFIFFTFTYWFLGSICWLIALYYYFTGKKVKWGPNYFST
jgi:cellulose synthase/poly-beta-1,6-N-acetylglucosamine synthase-like glycosyltransferase